MGEREDKREEGGVEGKRSLVSIGLCKDHRVAPCRPVLE